MPFKERLKELIDEKCDGKQIVLARGTGLAHSVISSYFVRGSIPSADQLVKIADFFGCTTDYLLGREDDYGIITAGQTTVLTKDEEELLSVYRKMDANTKQQTLGFFRAAFSSNF